MSHIRELVDENVDSVRHRLLDAAEKLFCEKGYDNTSVRDLTAAASCNVAAVNYYFGGKDKLYQEMFRRQMQIICESQMNKVDEILSRPNPTLEDFVREVITPPLQAAYEKQLRGQVMQLMVREVLNNSMHGEEIVNTCHIRIMNHTVDALMRLVDGLDREKARLIFSSLDSLQLHPFLFMDKYLSIIEGLTFDRLIDHIVRFACAAIRDLAKTKN
ncbi:MAG: TetR/AcrR family transcriptional regulator [Planctomycetes bacterium]|nr:TetR/AcrR family transcriptional regulator [Planctomycetota bacterium]